jgi:hypothetical protein
VGLRWRVGKDGPVTEPPTEPPESFAPTRRPGGRQTVGDLVRSMSLVLAAVAVVVLLTLRDDPEQPVQSVDFAQQLQEMRRVAAYDVVAPVGLDDRWKATSVRGDDSGGAVTWHIGFVTPEEHYAAIEQSDGPVGAFLDDHVQGATLSGVVAVSGASWQRLEGGKPEQRALVLRSSGVTTMVAGSATFAELRALASALRGG